MTIADSLVPQGWHGFRRRPLLMDMLLIVGGSFVVAAAAQIRIDLPFTPVPVTGQTFAVLLVGAALGARRGALSMVAYLIEGAAGLPVFSGGNCCIPVLAGPAGGYLLSYPLAAGLVGWLAEQGWDRKFTTTAVAMLAGNLVIYAGGLPWLALFVGNRVFAAGFIPFIPGDIFKLILAAIALPAAWNVIGRFGGAEG